MIPALVNLIVYLLIAGILIALVYYVVDAIPLPPPINRLIKLAVVVIACLIIVLLLLQLVGVGTGVPVPRLQ